MSSTEDGWLIRVLAQFGRFTVERRQRSVGPPALTLSYTHLYLNASHEGRSADKVLVRSDVSQLPWTVEVVVRAALIWLQRWQLTQITYGHDPASLWQPAAMHEALDELCMQHPSLDLAQYAYLRACSSAGPSYIENLAPAERSRREWWRWDTGEYVARVDGQWVIRILQELSGTVGDFALYAVDLEWPNGWRERASWYECVLLRAG